MVRTWLPVFLFFFFFFSLLFSPSPEKLRQIHIFDSKSTEILIFEPGLCLSCIQSSVAQTEHPPFQGGKQQQFLSLLFSISFFFFIQRKKYVFWFLKCYLCRENLLGIDSLKVMVCLLYLYFVCQIQNGHMSKKLNICNNVLIQIQLVC